MILTLCSVSHLRTKPLVWLNMILVNTGLKTPVILLKHEVTAGVPITKQARYNFVGIEESTLEKVGELCEPRLIFLPEPRTPGILLSNPLNKKIVWSELTKIWRDRDKVKGLIFNLIKGGYAVVIAGFVAPLLRSPLCKRNSSAKRLPVRFSAKRLQKQK
ncbi:hypothetical protein KP509_26G000400 [Ceratopteris richardii]|uniref:Ribosomal protein S1 n=1 Tax=Ceratopteris richardii TaxID=49495 RepID=A0A8T2RJQ1_CERRI|nr:hypothetical protein KP509_26G000400 [Ceratopteris richardii]